MQGTNLIELNKAYRRQVLSMINRTLSNRKQAGALFVSEYRKSYKKVTPRGRVLRVIKSIENTRLKKRFDEWCIDIERGQNAGK